MYLSDLGGKRDRVCGFSIELRGIQCAMAYAIEQSSAVKVPGVSGDSVRCFPTGLHGVPLLKTCINFASAVKSWASEAKINNMLVSGNMTPKKMGRKVREKKYFKKKFCPIFYLMTHLFPTAQLKNRGVEDQIFKIFSLIQ